MNNKEIATEKKNKGIIEPEYKNRHKIKLLSGVIVIVSLIFFIYGLTGPQAMLTSLLTIAGADTIVFIILAFFA